MSEWPRQRALQIFRETVGLPPSEQHDAVVRLCGDEKNLIDEVQALLQASDSAAPAIANITLTVAEPSAMRSPASAYAAIDEQSGSHIGPYKLLQLIGEGGFGSVFLAEQSQPVRRRVALKVIKLGMDTRQVVARFEQERQALAMMDHANIAKVFDAGATSAGRPYFVMELCKGVPITDYCDKHHLSIPDRLSLFLQVCHAVQHAHQKGLIHRDIKPSNILVSEDEGRHSAKVIDFGIAKATASKLTEKTLFTQYEQMVGTPAYMSPEQAEGSFDIDTRTDIYALGVLLYEMLTGSTPVDFTTLRSVGLDEIKRVIREVEPPVPSTRLSRSSDTLQAAAVKRQTEPRKLSALIRGDLDWIVMKALEKDRTRRYETASSLALDIGRHMSGRAVVAAPPGAGYRIRKFIKRNRAIVVTGAAVAAALLVGLSAFAWQAMLVRQQRDIAVSSQLSEATQRKIAEQQRTAAQTAADTAERAAYQAQIVSAALAIEDQRSDAAGALLAATSPRLRGWEYRHLASRRDPTLPSPFPADWLISGFSTSADSRVVAVRRSAHGGPVQWVVLGDDLRTERLVVPDTDAASFSLSPDGTRAVWASHGSTDRPAVLWNVDSNSVQATLPVENDPKPQWTQVVTWSPTGDRFLISHPFGYQMHDGRTGAKLLSKSAAGFMYFTGDDRWMLFHTFQTESGYNGREFQLFDARTFVPNGEIFRFESPVSQVAFHQSRIVCALDDGTLRLMEIDHGALREHARIVAGFSNFNALVWSPDDKLIASGSVVGGRVRVWDVESGALRSDLGGPEPGVAAQLFLPGSGDLCACDVAGKSYLWPMSDSSGGVLTHKSYVYPAVVSRDGGMLMTGGWDGLDGHPGGLKFWDARTGAFVAEYGAPGEIFLSADMTPDGRFAVASIGTEVEANRRTEVIDLTTGAVQTRFRPPSRLKPPVFTVVHPDGKRVISTCPSGEAYVWDLMTGHVLWETQLQSKADSQLMSAAAAVSPDGHLLAFADQQLGIRLVSADNYADLRRWDAHRDGIWSLSFSPDGKWVLSASDDQTVAVWDVATGSLIARLVGPGTKVLSAAMSPDGTRIATGGRDGIVRLWDTTHFENVAQLRGHTDYIFCLTWSPDGRQLFSTSGDSTVRIWDTRTLAEQVAATRARSEAFPRLDTQVTSVLEGAADPRAAAQAAIASPELTPRERELTRQAVARLAFRGAQRQ